MASQIKLRRGTANQWTTANPVLAEGEAGFETDTNQLKIGNGVDDWSTLDYISADLTPYLLASSASTTYATISSPDFSGNVFIDGTLLTSGSVNIQNTLLAGVVEAETGEFQGILTDTLTVGNVSNTEIGYLNNASANIQDQLNSKYDKLLSIPSARTFSFTLSPSDADKFILLDSNFDSITVTIPFNSNVYFPVGTKIDFLALGSNLCSFQSQGINDPIFYATPGKKLRAQFSSATLIKYKSDTWVLIGDLIA